MTQFWLAIRNPLKLHSDAILAFKFADEYKQLNDYETTYIQTVALRTAMVMSCQ